MGATAVTGIAGQLAGTKETTKKREEGKGYIPDRRNNGCKSPGVTGKQRPAREKERLSEMTSHDSRLTVSGAA